MSLDKILGAKKTISKPLPKKIKATELESEEIIDPNKHYLKCNNGKCKFQRVLRKRDLDEADFECEKCHGEMKEFNPRKKTTKKSNENEENEEEEES